MGVQVDVSHYSFMSYNDFERWTSYYDQINELLLTYQKGDSVLLIGVGDGIVPMVLKNICGSDNITTCDYDSSLQPDIVMDIRNYRELKNSYDYIICCEVLEHIEFEFFSEVIKYFSDICRKTLILSLPRRDMAFGIYLKLPLMKIKKVFYLPRIDGIWSCKEHYWELGCRSIPLRKVRSILKDSHFSISKEFTNIENTYNYFWICDKI